MKFTLPFPASSLAGHAKGNGQWKKIADTKKHREWARNAVLAVTGPGLSIAMPETGDISVCVRFVPADRRGDRVNFPNRMKPYFDGIADALGINDSRFVPSYEFSEPEKPGRVEIEVRAI